MSSYSKVLTLLHSSAFVWALILSLLGPMLALILKDFNLLYAQAGGLICAIDVGFMGGSFLGGILAKHRKRQRLMVINLLVLIFVCGSIALAPNYGILLGILAIGGLAGGSLLTIVNSLVGELYLDKRSAALNLLNVSFGIGSISATAYISGMVALGNNWRSIYALVIVPLSLVLSLSLITALPKRKYIENQDVTGISYIYLLKNPRVFLYTTSVLLSAGVEWGFTFWSVTYMTQFADVSYSIATNALSLFLAGMLFGRLAMSRVLASLDPVRVVQVIASGALVAVILFTLNLPSIVTVLSMAVFGLLLSGIFPTLMGLAMDSYPNQTGSVSGLLLLSSGFGSILMQGMIGFVADDFGLAWGIRLIPVWLGLLLFLLFRLRR